MENLKDFMLLFRAELTPDYQPSQEEMVAMKKSWENWIGGIAQKARLVSAHQLGMEANTILSNSDVKSGLLSDKNKSVSGSLVLKATDLKEATEMGNGCPILAVGGTVEIRNTLNVL